jgi:3-hydroxybutyryl-CoA dehydrogenase
MSTEQIAVIGAGLMGHGLAQVFAQAGHPVTIHDPDPAALGSVRERVAANLRELGGDPDAAQRITPHAELADAVAQADVVFEAAPERVALKQEVFAALERHAPPDAILATNTSVIPVARIAERVRSAGRVVGTHWWNPPYLVPLVEVVQAQRSDPAVVEATIALLRRAGKEPVHVRRDVPGFVGNRLQHALWREAFALVAAGVCDAETVDQVVRLGFGRRLAVMGPIETADYIGLDLTLDIHEQILHDLDVTPGPSPHLRELVERGDLGMKTGRGFRAWEADDQARARAVLLEHLGAGDRSEVAP